MSKAAVSSQRGNILLRMLPGLVVTIVAVAALFYFVDFREVQQAFGLADYRVLPLVILLFLGTVSARAMAWRTNMMERASFVDCFLVLNQGYLLNNILPFRLGELGRAVLLAGRVGQPFWRVLSSIVIERVFDLGIAAGMLFGTLPFVVGADWARSATVVAAVLVGAGFLVLFLMASRPQWIVRFVEFLTKPWPKLQRWAAEQLTHFLEGLSALRDGLRFLRVASWMILTWLFNVIWYYVLLRSFLPEATWLWAFFSIAVASLGVALPSSPAYIGVLETALVAALSLFGVDPAIALAYALVAHILYFIITGLIGIIGFWQQGQSLGDVYRQLLARPAAK
ncbi:MAG: lysylphosphatidylglycerol synthase transmembrane domain-containing protein [Anaerolineales bacterium]